MFGRSSPQGIKEEDKCQKRGNPVMISQGPAAEEAIS
jgi:hypothetical protein